MRPFGTFSKHITCQYYLMTWHILYFVYCIGNGAWAVSRCQEASSFGSSLSWARGLNRGGAKKNNPAGPPAAPTANPVVCRQQPAGGELGLAICSPPGSCILMREKERMCSSIHHCQGLSQAQKQYSSHLLTSENRAHGNCESVAAKLTRVRVCVRLRRTCFQHASVFSCQESYPDTSRTGRWSKKRQGRLVGKRGQSGGWNLRHWDPSAGAGW